MVYIQLVTKHPTVVLFSPGAENSVNYLRLKTRNKEGLQSPPMATGKKQTLLGETKSI